MEKINFIPRDSYILVTSNLVKKEDNGLLMKQAPEIKEIQQVVAIGPGVINLNVGDYVLLNMNNFIQTVKKQSTIRAGIGGQDMMSEQIVIPFFSVPGNETVYIKINSREIEGTIPDYDALPEVTKSFKTLAEFTLEQEAKEKEMQNVTKKGMKFAEKETDVAPLVITDSSKIKMY